MFIINNFPQYSTLDLLVILARLLAYKQVFFKNFTVFGNDQIWKEFPMKRISQISEIFKIQV
jgi:hypothetical protein